MEPVELTRLCTGHCWGRPDLECISHHLWDTQCLSVKKFACNNWRQFVSHGAERSLSRCGQEMEDSTFPWICGKPKTTMWLNDLEQLWSSINKQLIAGCFGHKRLRQLRTKHLETWNILQSVVDWYCYVTAHNQFAYIEECSNDPLRYYSKAHVQWNIHMQREGRTQQLWRDCR